MKITQPPVLKCKTCFTLNKPKIEDFDEPEIQCYERNMGPENEFLWSLDFECEKCKSELTVQISGWEYPTGIMNYQETETSGCSIVEEAFLEVEFDPNDFN